MTDIAKKDVTVLLTPSQRIFLPAPFTLSMPVISFGDGTLQYPTHGIPLPDAPGVFGMNKAIAYVAPVFLAGYVCVYDGTYNTIRIYKSAGTAAAMVELSSTTVPTLSFPMFVIGE